MPKDLLGRKVEFKKEEPKFMDKFLRYAWVFETWYEKLILAFLVLYGLYSLIRTFGG